MSSFLKNGLSRLRGRSTGAAESGGRGRPTDDENRLDYPTGDARFAEASAAAHRTLWRFFELANRRVPGVYLVKMRLAGGGEVEHIWVEVSGLRGSFVQGRLANDPIVPGYSIGDPVEVSRGEIEDWMINTGEHRYGGYSIRAMLDDMPIAMADDLRRQFRD